MRILVIDNFSYKAHKYFNQLHFETLLELGHTLHIIGRKGHFDNVEEDGRIERSDVPECFYSKRPETPFIIRLRWISCLLWLRLKFNPKHYDAVLIMTYDPMVIWVYRTRKTVMLVTHDGHYLDNKIKLLALKTTPKHYIHVCINQGMEKHLKELLPDRKVCYVPHGLYRPSYNYKKPSYLYEGEKFLFCPINMKYEKTFVQMLMEDKSLHSYLENNNLKFYVKKQLLGGDSKSPMIIPIDNDIPKQEYDFFMQNAFAVIIPYDKEYMYRTSGIMLECVIRDTPVITTKLEAMAEFVGKVNIQMFEDVNGLIEALEFYKNNKLISVDKSVYNPLPYWKIVFSNYFSI